jgi:YebC/PmpR family DNA-binding regulatory protein
MSGHSKWATTKHKKAVIDARRGKMFAKLIKNIEVAARTGGGDLSGNPTLYDAVQKAKKSSVPNDNIDRAVKRGSGAEAGGADYQTIMYEGYGPSGVAFLIECLTDNKNRAAMEVRTAMTRNGGSMADPGSVSYLFNRKGVVLVPQRQDGRTVGEDDVLEATLDAGAEEVNDLGDSFQVISEATDLVAVRTALQAAGLDYDSAEASFVPSMQVQLDGDSAAKVFRLVDSLVSQQDWTARTKVGAVFGRWDTLVGPDIAAHCRPESLTEGELLVVAESTAWATQLRLLAPSILGRLRAGVGGDVVTKLRVVGPTAPSWKKGPRTVRGRGPRDTYG